jgi:hypothetical protein
VATPTVINIHHAKKNLSRIVEEVAGGRTAYGGFVTLG